MSTAELDVTAQATLVHYEAQEGVAILTLDDPPANTYTHEMMRQLDAAILKARFDTSVDVIVIVGKITAVLLAVDRHDESRFAVGVI